MSRVPALLRVGAFATALATVLALPAPAAAQNGDLDRVLSSLTRHWARGDAGGLSAYLADGGADLDLQDGPAVRVVRGRKFSAALRRAFDGTETVTVVAGRASRVAGAEDRAFAEVDWEYRRHGANRTERSTVFFALVQEPRGWRVTQIRILR